MGPKTRGKKGDEPLDESRGKLNDLEDAVGLPRNTIPENAYGLYSEEVVNILKALEIFPNMRTVFRDRLEGIAQFQHFINRERASGFKVKPFVNEKKDELKNDLKRDVNLIRTKKSQDLLKRMAKEKIPEQFRMTYLYQTLSPENKDKNADKFYDEVIADDLSLGSLSRFTPSRTKISTPSTSGSRISGLTTQSTPGGSVNSLGQETFPGLGSRTGTIGTRLSNYISTPETFDTGLYSGRSMESTARRLTDAFGPEIQAEEDERVRGEVEGRLREAVEERIRDDEEASLREAEEERARRNTNLTPGRVVTFNDPDIDDDPELSKLANEYYNIDEEVDERQEQQVRKSQRGQKKREFLDPAPTEKQLGPSTTKKPRNELVLVPAKKDTRQALEMLYESGQISKPEYDTRMAKLNSNKRNQTSGQATGVATLNPLLTFDEPTEGERIVRASSSSEYPDDSMDQSNKPARTKKTREIFDPSSQGPQLQTKKQKQEERERQVPLSIRRQMVPRDETPNQQSAPRARAIQEQATDEQNDTIFNTHPSVPMTPEQEEAQRVWRRVGYTKLKRDHNPMFKRLEAYRNKVRYRTDDQYRERILQRRKERYREKR